VVARAGPGGAGGGDLYALLNVPSTATKKEIKAAYKKAALKFHPDVNKAPDAAERFNEVKQAYQTLADEDSRRRYDALRNGGFGGWKGNASRRDTSSSRSSRASRPSSSAAGGEAFGARTEDEPFYGFSDFWSDMEKEFAEFEKKRPDLGRPRTLWEELEALGEELVDFLEESAPEATTTSTDPFGAERRTTSSSSSGSARRKDGTASASYASSSSRTASSSASSATARSKAPPPKRESVDEMLEKLKRDMGMK
jgi:molecular chaperone DnaJ